MKSIRPALLALTAGFTILTCNAADPSASASTSRADQVLRAMSSRLASAGSFSFAARRHSHGALIPGRAIPEEARIAVTVLRPDGILAKSTSPGDVRTFTFDGHALTVLDVTKNCYGTVPLHGSIDSLLVDAEARYGLMLPLGELAVSNPYDDIRHKAQSIAYLGRSRVWSGFMGAQEIECDRIQLRGRAVDAELWVGTGDHLPRKLVVSFKHHPGHPNLTPDISSWNLAPQVKAADFVFHPPKGAVKIPIMTTAEIQAGRVRAPKK